MKMREIFFCGSKNLLASKTGRKEEAYYKKILFRIKRGGELRLGATINKIESSDPKISLINCIGTPPNSPSKKR